MNIILFERGETRFARGDARAEHIRKILRKGAGDTFLAGEIDGPEGTATIVSADDSGVRFSFEAERPARPLFPVRLVVGFPRPIQLKRLLRDLASLGVESVSLCGTELGEKSYLESSLVDRGAARSALLDGCMQAGGTAVPALSMRASVGESLANDLPPLAGVGADLGAGYRILLDLEGAEGGLATLPLGPDGASGAPWRLSAESPLTLALGSERGWTARERETFAAAGFRVASLGPRVLRTETACVAAVSIALARAGFLDAGDAR